MLNADAGANARPTITSAVLIYGSPARSPDLFHATALDVIDPFLYVEVRQHRYAVITELDAASARSAELEVLEYGRLGRDRLLARGVDRLEADAATYLHAVRQMQIRHVCVPADFPLWLGDRLRSAGITVDVDPAYFACRRRRKTPAQMEGIRRAQHAADAAIAEARRLIWELPRDLTASAVRAAMQAVCASAGCDLADTAIVAPGSQAAVPHVMGSGPIIEGAPVLIDIWPRDRATRCHADMSRTFVAGGRVPDAELQAFWELSCEARAEALAVIREGASGHEVYLAAAKVFSDAGEPTKLTKRRNEVLVDGLRHNAGHGIGLDVHEPPSLGPAGGALAAGDVLAVELGCYRQGFGGCRVEDLVIVTENGIENLTDSSLALTP